MKLELLQHVKIPSDINLQEASQLCGDIGDQPNQNQDGMQFFVNTKMQFQKMQGVGGSFSEIGGKAMLSLDADAQQTLAKNMFADSLTYFRLPVGASDFALDAYSLDDVDGDFGMEQFSLTRDEQYLLPFMRLAKQHCPDMKLHASPWSPPAWLKEGKDMCNGAHFVDDPAYYKAYALYFAKYIAAYAEQGFDIERLNVQNEPDVNPKYPSCQMPNWQMIKFIKEYLYPTLKEHGIDTEIFGGTFRTVNEATACEFLTADPDIANYIGGIGCQYSVMQALYNIGMLYPDLKLMHTESNCFNGDNTWPQAMALYTILINYINAGCDVFTYWNMILNETGESGWGWKQNSLINIDETKKTVTYNPDYYVMQAVASCIQPGATRILYACRSKAGLAFLNEDGSVTLLVSNFTDKALQASAIVDGTKCPFTLEPMSIMSLKLTQE